jgi:RIO kinase 2
MGFDILALKALLARGVIASVGSQIGVGKESDIFEAQDPDGNEVVIKIHRLGRTSFRAVRRHRDYMSGKSKASWLYMSRLAAIKEFAFMKALHAHGFPTPIPIDQSRHVVAMSRINGFPMAQIKAGKLPWAEDVYLVCIALLKRLAEHGLVHCDFNEFNLMIDDECKVTLIDFPQMVSTSHPNAAELFQRDVNGLVKFFAMKMRYIPPEDLIVKLDDVVPSDTRIDEEVRASGFSEREDQELIGFITESRLAEAEAGEGSGEDNDSDDDDDDDGDDVEEADADADGDGGEAPTLVEVGNEKAGTGLSVFDFAAKATDGVERRKGVATSDDEEEDDDIEAVLAAGDTNASRATGVDANRQEAAELNELEGSELSDGEEEGELVGELSEEALKQAKEKART